MASRIRAGRWGSSDGFGAVNPMDSGVPDLESQDTDWKGSWRDRRMMFLCGRHRNFAVRGDR